MLVSFIMFCLFACPVVVSVVEIKPMWQEGYKVYYCSIFTRMLLEKRTGSTANEYLGAAFVCLFGWNSIEQIAATGQQI